MPASQRSLAVTDAYRDRLAAIRKRAQRTAEARWPTIDTLDGTDWASRTAQALSQAQQEAVRASAGYLSAYLSSELGQRVRGPQIDSRKYAGKSRDGRSLVESLKSPLIGTLAALRDGASPNEALERGRNRALRMIEMDLMHAARTSLNDGMEADERIQGWQRAVRGTCGACMGDIAVETSVELPSIPLRIHPNCQCVTEPVVGTKSRMNPSAEVQKQYAGALRALGRHRWPEAETLPVKIVRSTKRTRVSDGELVFKGKKPLEIRMRAIDDIPGVKVSKVEAEHKLIHEAGHYLDWLFLGKSRGVVSKNRVLDSAINARPTPAMKRFVEAARNTPSMKRHLDDGSDYSGYLTTPSEMWARAYAQWAQGGKAVKKEWTDLGLAWPKSEFHPVGRAVEGVLREAGLL